MTIPSKAAARFWGWNSYGATAGAVSRADESIRDWRPHKWECVDVVQSLFFRLWIQLRLAKSLRHTERHSPLLHLQHTEIPTRKCRPWAIHWRIEIKKDSIDSQLVFYCLPVGNINVAVFAIYLTDRKRAWRERRRETRLKWTSGTDCDWFQSCRKHKRPGSRRAWTWDGNLLPPPTDEDGEDTARLKVEASHPQRERGPGCCPPGHSSVSLWKENRNPRGKKTKKKKKKTEWGECKWVNKNVITTRVWESGSPKRNTTRAPSRNRLRVGVRAISSENPLFPSPPI